MQLPLIFLFEYRIIESFSYKSNQLEVKYRMPILRFPALMKFYVDNQSEFRMSGATVAELLDNLLVRFPTLKAHLLDSNGALRRHFNIFVHGVHLRELNGMDTVLKEDDKVILMASAAGG